MSTSQSAPNGNRRRQVGVSLAGGAAVLMVALGASFALNSNNTEATTTAAGQSAAAGGNGAAPNYPPGKSVALSPQLSVKVKTLNGVKVAARGPGEISGQGVAAEVTFQNESTAPVALDGVVVNATLAGKPGLPAGDEQGLPSKLAPGASATAVYRFTFPGVSAPERRVVITVQSGTGAQMNFARG